MKRRYLVLLGIVVALAVTLTLVGRLPRGERGAAVDEAGTPVSAVALALEIRDGAVAPSVSQAPKDHRVDLTVTNRGAAPVRLALAGYEDRLAIPEMAPGASWSGTFVADRPGEDFVWVLNGEPSGRFTVTGSHLVEGHK